MLSDQTRTVIKATIPVLREHGQALTRHFYARMFQHDPSVKAYFNAAHQHAGTQSKALASAILAYAEHIDNPTALADAIELIAQKHVSLGVQSDHYPIVGKHLLASIKELLGDAATDEVIDAWAEAYGLLADVCIQREQAIYQQQQASFGWTGFRPFRVDRIVDESDVVRSLHLKPADGQALAAFLPGQYITVRLPLADGGTTMRNYSLSAAPAPDSFRISVKREEAMNEDAPAGYVSHFLHDRVRVGDHLEVGPPCGNFTLDLDVPDDRPLVLLSGGIGVTPLLAMLHTAVKAQPGRPIVFIHAALNSRTHAFRDEVQQLAADHPTLRTHIRYSDPIKGDMEGGRCDSTGFVDEPLIRSLVPSNDAAFYFCGPKPFMVAVHQVLDEWDVAMPDRHFEFFGPAQELTAGVASTH